MYTVELRLLVLKWHLLHARDTRASKSSMASLQIRKQNKSMVEVEAPELFQNFRAHQGYILECFLRAPNSSCVSSWPLLEPRKALRYSPLSGDPNCTKETGRAIGGSGETIKFTGITINPGVRRAGCSNLIFSVDIRFGILQFAKTKQRWVLCQSAQHQFPFGACRASAALV